MVMSQSHHWACLLQILLRVITTLRLLVWMTVWHPLLQYHKHLSHLAIKRHLKIRTERAIYVLLLVHI